LVKLGKAIFYSDNISENIKSKLFKPIDLLGDFPPSMANGWVILKNQERGFMYGKVGRVTGGSSVLLIIPDKKIVIAGATNLTLNEDIPVFNLIEPFLTDTESKNQKNETKK